MVLVLQMLITPLEAVAQNAGNMTHLNNGNTTADSTSGVSRDLLDPERTASKDSMDTGDTAKVLPSQYEESSDAPVVKEKPYRTKASDFVFDPVDRKITGLKDRVAKTRICLVIPEKIKDIPVERIDAFAFDRDERIVGFDCSAAKYLKVIGAYALSWSNVERFDPDGAENLETIEKYAFAGSPLKEVKLPTSGRFKEVQRGAFLNHEVKDVKTVIRDAVEARKKAQREAKIRIEKFRKDHSGEAPEETVPGDLKTDGAFMKSDFEKSKVLKAYEKEEQETYEAWDCANREEEKRRKEEAGKVSEERKDTIAEEKKESDSPAGEQVEGTEVQETGKKPEKLPEMTDEEAAELAEKTAKEKLESAKKEEAEEEREAEAEALKRKAEMPKKPVKAAESSAYAPATTVRKDVVVPDMPETMNVRNLLRSADSRSRSLPSGGPVARVMSYGWRSISTDWTITPGQAGLPILGKGMRITGRGFKATEENIEFSFTVMCDGTYPTNNTHYVVRIEHSDFPYENTATYDNSQLLTYPYTDPGTQKISYIYEDNPNLVAEKTFTFRLTPGNIESGDFRVYVYASDGSQYSELGKFAGQLGANVAGDFRFQKEQPSPGNSQIEIQVPGYTGPLTVSVNGTVYQTDVQASGAALINDVPVGANIPIVYTVPSGWRLQNGESASKTVTIDADPTKNKWADTPEKRGLKLYIERDVPTEKLFKVQVFEAGSKTPIPGVNVLVTDDNGQLRGGMTVDNGKVSFNGFFTLNKDYVVTATKDGYSKATVTWPYKQDATLEIDMVKDTPQPAQFRVQVRDKETGAPVPGVLLAVTDSAGRYLSSGTNGEGIMQIPGTWIDGQSYTVEFLTVPSEYLKPAPVQVPFNIDKNNPSESVLSWVTISKRTTPVGTLNVKTDVTDANVTVNFYKGPLEDPNRQLIHGNVIISPGEIKKLTGFIDNEVYSFKILSTSNYMKYQSGADVNFTFKSDTPNMTIHVTERTDDGYVEIRVHDKDATGPLSSLMDGKELRVKAGWYTLKTNFSGGTAKLKVPMGPYEMTIYPPEPPAGYELITYRTKFEFGASEAQDWVIIKSGSQVQLHVKPPEGYSMDPNITVTLADADGNPLRDPVPIGDGNLLFEHVNRGKTYQFIYKNVPSGWIHANNFVKVFTVEPNAAETIVNDAFGYKNPDADKTVFLVNVKNKQGQPVPGYVFELKDSAGKLLCRVTTDSDGHAEYKFDPKLPPGEYTVTNTFAPDGYEIKRFKPTTLTDKDHNIGLDVVVDKASAGTMDLTVKLLDPDGNPLPHEKLNFYRTDVSPESLISEVQTDKTGETKLTGLNKTTGQEFRFAMVDKNSPYEIIEEDGVTRKIPLTPGENHVLTIRTKRKPDFSRMHIVTRLKDGNPAPYNKIKITRPDGTSFVTATNEYGEVWTDYMPNGNYKVEIEEYSQAYKPLAPADRVKNVTLSGGDMDVIFDRQEKNVQIITGDVGSLKIEGTPQGDYIHWKVTVVKEASNTGSKRAPINRIRYSAKEMFAPTNLTLTVDGQPAKINGRFNRFNDTFELVDDRSAEKTTEKQTFVYEFDAKMLDKVPSSPNPNDPTQPESPGYRLFAETDIKSDNPAEKFERMRQAAKVKPIKDNIHMKIKGGGVVQSTLDIRWEYDIHLDTEQPGHFLAEIKIPHGEAQMPMSPENVKVYLYPKLPDGTVDTAHPMEVTPGIQGDKFIIAIPAGMNFDKDFHMLVTTKGQKGNMPMAGYKQDVTLKFEKRNVSGEWETIDTLEYEALAAPISLPSGTTKETDLVCWDYDPPESKRFHLFQRGTISDDGKYINWTVRATNTSDGLLLYWPIQMIMTPGAGLGGIKDVSLKASGESFPFIDRDSYKDPWDDNNLEFNGFIGVRVMDRDLTSIGRENPADIDYRGWEGKDKHKDWYSPAPHLKKYMPYVFQENGIPKKYQENGVPMDFRRGGQRLKPGDFVEVSFTTPITDFSRISEGYELKTDLKPYPKLWTFAYIPSWDWYGDAPESCTLSDTLVLKRRKFQNRYYDCRVEAGYGFVDLNGRYTDDGRYIIWHVQPQMKRRHADDNDPQRYFEFDIEFVRASDNSSVPDIYELGLTNRNDVEIKRVYNERPDPRLKTQYVTPEAREDPAKQLTSYVNWLPAGRSGIRIHEYFEKNFRQTDFYIKVPVRYGPNGKPIPMEAYHMKIQGKVHANTESGWRDEPLKSKYGGNSCVATVEGLTGDLRIDKRWVNIFADQRLPEVYFDVYSVDINGRESLVSTVRGDPGDYVRYTDGGFPAARASYYAQAMPNFDQNGNRLTYIIRERPIDGFKEEYLNLVSGGKHTLVTNVRTDFISQTDDPTEYITDQSGTYPKDYRQDGSDIRNAYTALDKTPLDKERRPIGNDSGRPYTIQYEDSFLAKHGEQTDTPGEFKMELSVEGRGSGYVTRGLDVVIVMDNSGTMRQPLEGYTPDLNKLDNIQGEVSTTYWRRFSNSKMTAMRQQVVTLSKALFDKVKQDGLPQDALRIGLVNFATKVDPMKNSTALGNGTYSATGTVYDNGKETFDLHYARPKVPLQASMTDAFKRALPITWRSIDGANRIFTAFAPELMDGQTNVQEGIRYGVNELYADGNRDRKKVLVLMTDGAPSAHNYCTNIENPTNDWNTVTNTAYPIPPASQYFVDNHRVDNHGQPAIWEMDFWKRTHPDLEVFTLSMDPYRGNDDATPQEQINFLRTLSSNPATNHFTVSNAADFEKAITSLQSSLTKQTFSMDRGIITDPVGKMVQMKDVNGDGKFTIATTEECLDGDYFVHDSLGTYLKPDGTVGGVPKPAGMYSAKVLEKVPLGTGATPTVFYDIVITPLSRLGIWYYRLHGTSGWQLNGEDYGKQMRLVPKNANGTNISWDRIEEYYNRGDLRLSDRPTIGQKLGKKSEYQYYVDPLGHGQSYLSDVTVVKKGDGFEMAGLTLGDNQRVYINYRIQLRTTDNAYMANTYYQANKTTTFQPRPHSDKPEIKAIKRYFPIPSVKGPSKPLILQKNWEKNGQSLTPEEAETLVATFKLIRYTAKAARPHPGFDEKDPATRTEISEVKLDASDNWKVKFDSLLAYDDEGKEFFYEFEEVDLPEGWKQKKNGTVTKLGDVTVTDGQYEYSKEKGTFVIPGTDVAAPLLTEVTNELRHKFIIRKIDATETVLQGAEFTLYEKDNPSEPLYVIQSGQNGKIVFDKLVPGEYLLRETRAPDGYQLDSSLYLVTVYEGGHKPPVKLERVTKNLVPSGEIAPIGLGGDDAVTFNIVNQKFEIPNTGAFFGIPWWLILSALTILGFCGFALRRMKKEEVRTLVKSGTSRKEVITFASDCGREDKKNIKKEEERHMKKKLLSLLMVLAMLLSIMPAAVNAAEDPETKTINIHKLKLTDEVFEKWTGTGLGTDKKQKKEGVIGGYTGVQDKAAFAQLQDVKDLLGSDKSPEYMDGVYFVLMKETGKDTWEYVYKSTKEPKTIQTNAKADATIPDFELVAGLTSGGGDLTWDMTGYHLTGNFKIVEDTTKSTYVSDQKVITRYSQPIVFTLPYQAESGVESALHLYPKDVEDEVVADKDFTEKFVQGPDGWTKEKVKTGSTTKKNTSNKSIGDVVNYSVRNIVPAHSNFKTYVMADTMSKGLTFNKDVTVYKVTPQSPKDVKEVFAASNYTITNTLSGFELKLNDTGLTEINEKDTPVYLQLDYTATVNKDAVVDNEIPNEYRLVYSNGPRVFNEPEPQTGKKELGVDKKWVSKDASSNPPSAAAEAIFDLYEQVGSDWKLVDTWKANATNGWTHKFTGLDDKKTYKVKERISRYDNTVEWSAEGSKWVFTNKEVPTPPEIVPEPPKVVTGGKRFVKTNDQEKVERLSGAEFVVYREVTDPDAAPAKKKEYLAAKTDGTDSMKAYLDAEAAYAAAIKAANDKLAELVKGGMEAEAAKKDPAYTGLVDVIKTKKEARDAAYVASNMQYKWVSDVSQALTFTSLAEGQFEIVGLEYGDYFLQETKAPEGYALQKDAFPFRVEKGSYAGAAQEMEYKKIDDGTGSATNAKLTGTEKGQQLKNKKYDIPKTGGIGTVIFTVVGLGVIGLAFVSLKRRRAGMDEE